MRVLLLTGLLLTLGFALMIGVITGQPLVETEASQFYREIFSCPSLCLMGIVPGETTLNSVDNLLRDHAWVGMYRMQRGMEMDSGYIEWEWSGEQPDFIDSTRRGALNVQSGIVSVVLVHLRLTLAEICQFMPPDGFDMRTLNGGRVTFSAHYDTFGVTLQTGAVHSSRTVQANWVRGLRAQPLWLRVENQASLLNLGYTNDASFRYESSMVCSER